MEVPPLVTLPITLLYKRWRMQIRVDGERMRIDGFTSAEEAGCACLAAKAQLHPFATVGG